MLDAHSHRTSRAGKLSIEHNVNSSAHTTYRRARSKRFARFWRGCGSVLEELAVQK